MKTPDLRLRPSVIAAAILVLPLLFTACATLTPEEQRAQQEKNIKSDMQRTDIQVIHPFVAAGAKFGGLPENGEFTAWGWPCMLYFGDKMIVQVTDVEMGLMFKRMVAASLSAEEIREVRRVRSADGYEAVILGYDENISYYVIPWGVAELSPFGEIKTFTANVQDKGAASADRLEQLLSPKIQPRPANAPPQLIDKHPSQFLKEAKSVEGVFQQGWNAVEIDGKGISLIFEIRKGVPMLGYYKARGALGLMEKLMLEIPIYPVNPGNVSFVVEGVTYVATIVHARDGSWRYRVQIPEPVQ